MSPRVRVWRLAVSAVERCAGCGSNIDCGDRYVIDDAGLWHERHHPSYDPLRHEWNRLLADDDLKVITGTLRHPRELRYRRHTRGT